MRVNETVVLDDRLVASSRVGIRDWLQVGSYRCRREHPMKDLAALEQNPIPRSEGRLVIKGDGLIVLSIINPNASELHF